MIAMLGQVEALFTAPWLAAAGAVAVAVPIAIHLLSRFRRRAQPWGAMRFVYEALQRQRRRLQMEQWLLLLVRCLIVLVLGLALAGPVLTGCADRLRSAGLLLPGGAPRSVYLVVDDSLSSQAVEPGAETARFEALREAALGVVDALGPGDRLRVWRASRPVGEVGGVDAGGEPRPFAALTGLRGEIEGMRARGSEARLDEALAQVAEAVRAERDRPNAVVVVLSDFTRADIDPAAERGPGALPAGTRLVVSRPAAGVANAQVAEVRPWRRVIVADRGDRASVPVELTLRRFESAGAGGERRLVVTLLDSHGRSVGAAERSVSWAAGQAEQTLTLDVPVEPSALAGDADQRVGLVVRAVLEAGAGAGALDGDSSGSSAALHSASEPAFDALGADDVRLAAVEVRRRLRVALVSEPGAGLDDGGLNPAVWLRFALAPGGDDGAVQVSALTPGELSAVDDQRLAGHDAVIVARPELVSESAWRRLARYVETGGLAWVFPAATDEPQMWPRSLRSAFGVAWRVGIEPAAVGDAQRGAGLSSDAARPEALSLLSTDWEALLRPVRVTRWLPLWTPEADAWLQLSQPAAEETSGGRSAPALLARHEHGRGALLVSSVALDAAWTNLATKPLFVPLVHEALRGVIGRGTETTQAATAGDAPALSPAWPGGLRTLEPVLIGVGAGDNAAPAVALQRTDAGLTPTRPLDAPAAYRDPTDATPARLVVNVSAPAGDTTAVDEAQLSEWLDGWGEWSFLDPRDIAGSLRSADDARPNLGWPLLWALLGLVLLETVLARSFSHAKALQHRGLTAVVLERLRRFHRPTHRARAEESAPARGRAA